MFVTIELQDVKAVRIAGVWCDVAAFGSLFVKRRGKYVQVTAVQLASTRAG